MRLFGEAAPLLAEAGVDLAVLAELEAEVARSAGLPEGPRADIHVHLGRDRDGHALSVPELVDDMDRWGIGQAAVFALNDPGPAGDFADANAGVTAGAARSHGRLIPFCRIDPHANAAQAIARAEAAGARGLKLHPVAQRFAPEAPEVVACVARATDLGWPVLIHAGFGARALVPALTLLADAVPGARLILAHAARGDARAVRRALVAHPGVWFDTSLAALPDVVDLPPERLVFGSDRPYGDYATGLQLVGCAARIAGWSADQLRGVMSGNFAALAEA
jgi:predicted TIM-barrel fold metal-dependent hydrolase